MTGASVGEPGMLGAGEDPVGAAAAVGGPTALDPEGHLRAAAADCVHCGFCLPACPTYQLWGEEMDSPRGRIHLIHQVLNGATLTEAATTHLDRCLGCMACLTACPSGVRYNELIEAARTWTEEPPADATVGPPRSARDRAFRSAIFATFPYPRRLRALTAPLRLMQRSGLQRRLGGSDALRRLAPEASSALRLAPRAVGPYRRLPARVPARGQRRAVVGMLTGCVQDVFFPQVNAATARVLAAVGCDVIIPPDQGCCGALSLHSGRAEQAARFARRTIETFERAGVDVIVVNSAGCGSAMKQYVGLLSRAAGDGAEYRDRAGRAGADRDRAGRAGAERDRAGRAGAERDRAAPEGAGQDWASRAGAFSARVRDLTEFLAEMASSGDQPVWHPLPVTVAYHDACHLAHAQRIRRQPRDLLRAIPSVTVVEVGDAGTCCGSAGVYNLLEPETAAELGQRKADAVRATGARLVVSANPGCSLQIAAALRAEGGTPGGEKSVGAESVGAAGGTAPAVLHIAELLDASLRGLPVSALTG
jgi:glycolate oxidase iron-sulfur subunit